jgi:signal transduction histidine kinase
MPFKNLRIYPPEKSFRFLISLFVSFVFIFGVASLIAYHFYSNATRYAIRSNQAKANLVAKLMMEHQRAAIGVIRSYGSRPLLINSVKNKNLKEVIRHLASLVKDNPEIEMTFITDPVGTLWANFPIFGEALNQNLSYRDWYKGVSRKWMPYVSTLYKLIVGEKDLAIAVCSPLRDEKGKVIGILAGVQTTGFFKKIITEIGLDADTQISLIDQEGHIIYSNRFPYNKEVIGYPSSEFVRMAMRGKKGDIEIRDSSDGDKIKYVSFEPVEGIGWSVIIEQSKNEVLKSIFVNLILIAIVSVLIFSVVMLSLVYLRGRQRQVNALQGSENRLRILASQLLGAQEKERKLVANELHDGIGSSLNAIKFSLENTLNRTKQDGAYSESLKRLLSITQQAIEECRRMQSNLRPSTLDDLGILPTLDWYCREFQKIYPHIRVKKEIEISEEEVPDSLKTVIFRISQEALNNVAKHGQANLVHLRLQKTNGPIELTIQDNGQGFDVNEVFSTRSTKRGLGLSSMGERAELSGGSFLIESNKGTGTVIRVSWPIEQVTS